MVGINRLNQELMTTRIHWVLLFCLGLGMPLAKAEKFNLSEHPRNDYLNVQNIDEMENGLREALGAQERYSFY